MESKSIVQATSSNFTVGIEFSALPEGCIAGILAWTSPRDVCRMSAVSLEFLSAAESDALWETFLPADYREIIGLSSESSSHLSISSKKEVFFRLCNSPLLIDGGKKVIFVQIKFLKCLVERMKSPNRRSNPLQIKGYLYKEIIKIFLLK